MSKNLLILSLFIFSILKLNAQCTPDGTITKPGFYPSSLPDALIGSTYNEVINFKIIKDTMVVVFGSPTKATIDSATIVKVNGMPNGLTFNLNKPSKTYTPAETGCALISGTPTKSGTFSLQIVLKIYAKISGFPIQQADTIKNFEIIVKPSANITQLDNETKFIFPNPLLSNELNFDTKLIKPNTIITIYNSQGQLLDIQKIENNQSSITFNFPKGLYWLSIISENSISRMKLIKN